MFAIAAELVEREMRTRRISWAVAALLRVTEFI